MTSERHFIPCYGTRSGKPNRLPRSNSFRPPHTSLVCRRPLERWRWLSGRSSLLHCSRMDHGRGRQQRPRPHCRLGTKTRCREILLRKAIRLPSGTLRLLSILAPPNPTIHLQRVPPALEHPLERSDPNDVWIRFLRANYPAAHVQYLDAQRRIDESRTAVAIAA